LDEHHELLRHLPVSGPSPAYRRQRIVCPGFWGRGAPSRLSALAWLRAFTSLRIQAFVPLHLRAETLSLLTHKTSLHAQKSLYQNLRLPDE
jgi:hypothetical protein